VSENLQYIEASLDFASSVAKSIRTIFDFCVLSDRIRRDPFCSSQNGRPLPKSKSLYLRDAEPMAYRGPGLDSGKMREVISAISI